MPPAKKHSFKSNETSTHKCTPLVGFSFPKTKRHIEPTMNTVTHALLPVICVRLIAKSPQWLGRRGPIYIGLAGAMPDLINPHLSLEARLTSWSHGIPFWLAISTIFVISSLCSRGQFSVKLAACMSAAYLLHIICDAISGGVNFFYPIRNATWGDYWVDPLWWIPLDIICLLLCYTLFRLIPLWKQRKSAAKH
jgi:membrane-bound metal-dependent hydrolase YbcI (DUF457 family)